MVGSHQNSQSIRNYHHSKNANKNPNPKMEKLHCFEAKENTKKSEKEKGILVLLIIWVKSKSM